MKKGFIFLLMLILALSVLRFSVLAYAEETGDPYAGDNMKDGSAELHRASGVNLVGEVFRDYTLDPERMLVADPAKTTLAVYDPEPGHSYAVTLKGNDGTAIPVFPVSVVCYDENMTVLAAEEDAEVFKCLENVKTACAFITVCTDQLGRDRRPGDEDWMVYDVTAHGEMPVFHPAWLPQVLTPEFFGTPDDTDNLQACFSEGGDICLEGVYEIGSRVLHIEKPCTVIAGTDSGIYAEAFDGDYYRPMIEVLCEDVTLRGLRLFSQAEFSPYIDVRAGINNQQGRASNRIGISIWASYCHVIDLYGENIGLIRLENADYCVFDGLHGRYIENGIYTPGTTGTVVTNADFLVSRMIHSVYYHYFYFANPVDCLFSNIVAGAVGNADFCNSDIFHFNYSAPWKSLGSLVTVTNATALDNSFYRFAQCNNRVQAHFANCSGRLRDQICLLSNEAEATFEDCDFTVTQGSKKVYALRCSSAFNKIILNHCKITDLSNGYLFSDGVIASDCDFSLKVMNINSFSTVGSVQFQHCRFNAKRLISVAPDEKGFIAVYRECEFVFAESHDYFVDGRSSASILVSGGSVENCANLVKGKLNDRSHVSTALKSIG